MKLLSIIPALGLMGFAILACPCCTGSKASTALAAEKKIEQKSETVERYYFVKGMHCGGCKLGVKSALKDSALKVHEIVEIDHNSPDPENKVGHAKVRFLKSDYQGKETDCKIAKKIKDDLGYAAYWDKTNTNPCDI